MSRQASSHVIDALLRLARFQVTESRAERFLKLAADARSRITEIPPSEAAPAIKRGVMLLDVREKPEFQRGHIPGASHLPRGLVELEIERLVPEADAEIIVYCGRGNRSALVTDNLQRMDYVKVRSLAGGFQGWLEAGLPVWRNSRLIED